MRLPWIAAAGILLLLVSGAVLDALSGHGAGLAFAVVWSVGRARVDRVRPRRRHAAAGASDRLAAAGERRRAGGDGVRRRATRAYAVLGHPGSLPGGAWAILLSDRAWPLLFASVTAIAWVFPDGRLPSPALAAVGDRRGAVVRRPGRVHAAGGPSRTATRSPTSPTVRSRSCRTASSACRWRSPRSARSAPSSAPSPRCGSRLRRSSGIERQPAAVARLRRGAGPRRRRGLPAGDRRHRRRRPGHARGRGRGADGGARRGRRSRSCATGSTRSTG